MHKCFLHMLIAAAALLFTQGLADAGQHEQVRDGFWFGGGLGFGSAGASATELEGDGRDGGITVHLKAGGTLGKNTLLGGELNGWTKSEEGTTMTLGAGTAALYYYPMPDSGLFVKGGLGFSFTSLEMFGYEYGRSQSWGLLAGLGYDYRIGVNTSITPVVNFYMGGPSDLESDLGDDLKGYKFNVIEFGVGVTFH
ncbi:MAG: hypothetical protein JXO72_02280 [Vicinamibacteria bacterium]|nr:hypothetical protein [Vicinamibacteria bacterium]